MSNQLSTLLPLIEPGLSRELVTNEALTGIRSLMAHLPILSGGGFECPLGTQRGPVDMAMRVTESDGGFTFLAAWQPRGGHNGWEAMREFARNQKECKLRDAVQEAWLEFDLDASIEGLVAPNFFFKLEPYFAKPTIFGPSADARLKETVGTINRCLSLLGIELSEVGRAMLEHCVKCLPASSDVAFVGAMLQRGRSACRLTLGNMPLSELTAYLHKIGWAHRHEPLIPIIDLMGRHVRSVALHVDVSERPLGRIGMEVKPDAKAGGTGAWESFLLELVAAGLCTRANVESILGWPGRMHRSSFEGTWPAVLGREHNYFVRSINHIKLSYDPALLPSFAWTHQPLITRAATGMLTAKAYLAFNYSTVFPHPALWHG